MNIFTQIPAAFNEISVLVIAAIPVLELRASIPYAIGYLKMNPWQALALSVIGSWIPAFFIIFLLEHIEPLLRKNQQLGRILDKIYAKTRSKSESIKEFEFWGLVLFIGIPLPGTGVWTGTLAAYLLGLSKFKTIIAAFLGTLTAGTIMVFLSQYIALIIKYFFVITIISIFSYLLFIKFRKK